QFSLPEPRPRLQEYTSLGAEHDILNHMGLGLGPGRLHGDAAQDGQWDAADQVLGLKLFRLAELAQLHRHRRFAALDGRDRAPQAQALAKAGGERVREQLIASPKAIDLALEYRQAAALHDGHLPDAEQGRDLVVARRLAAIAAAQAVEAKRCIGGAVLDEQL